MKKQIIKSLVILAAAFVFTACDKQMNQTFIINPDGSGKMTIESGLNDPASPVDEGILKKNIAGLISSARGVESWENLVVNKPGNGKKYQIEATGYFPDINQVKIEEAIFTTIVYRNKNGIASLEMTGSQNNSSKKMGRAEAAKSAAETQKSWKDERKKLEVLLGKTEIIMNFILPGRVNPVKGITTGKNSATVVLDGKKLLAVMDAVNANKNLLIQDNMNGNKKATDAFVYSKLYGSPKKPVFKTTGPLKPFFNYKTEVAKARKNYPAMLTATGIDKVFRERNTEFLFHAVDWGYNEERIRPLLAQDIDINYRKKDEKDPESGRMVGGHTVLIRAVQGENTAIVKMLIAAGADVNIADNLGRTPLLHAVSRLNAAILGELIRVKADLNHTTSYSFDDFNIEKFSTEKTALILAVEKLNVDIVKLLVDAGADVNVNAGSANSALGFINNILKKIENGEDEYETNHIEAFQEIKAILVKAGARE